MHREKLLKQLWRYRDIATTELQKVDRIIEFVQNNALCFERSLKSGHITGSAWLINTSGDKALLGLHKKLGIWTQLGGHADGESDILKVALREAQEESGISAIEPISEDIFDVDVHLIPERPNEPEHYHYDIRYLLQVTGDDDFTMNHEMNDLRWFAPDEALGLPKIDDSIVRMIKKHWECEGSR